MNDSAALKIANADLVEAKKLLRGAKIIIELMTNKLKPRLLDEQISWHAEVSKQIKQFLGEE